MLRIGSVVIDWSDQTAPEIPHVHLDLYAGAAADQAVEVERFCVIDTRA